MTEPGPEVWLTPALLPYIGGPTRQQQGREIARSGGILEMIAEGGRLWARVQGTGGIYEVTVHHRMRRFGFSCSCPAGLDDRACKHVAAVVVTFLEQCRKLGPPVKADDGRPLIYYAHAMEDYGSEIEREDEVRLVKAGYRVLNPNSPEHERNCRLYRGYSEMGYFFDLVKSCQAIAYRDHDDRYTTMGVKAEVSVARKAGHPVFRLSGSSYRWQMEQLPTEPDQLSA